MSVSVRSLTEVVLLRQRQVLTPAYLKKAVCMKTHLPSFAQQLATAAAVVTLRRGLVCLNAPASAQQSLVLALNVSICQINSGTVRK